VTEDMEKRIPEADIQAEEDAPDVEAHKRIPAEEFAATEEGPDVEAHKLPPKHTP
jgi:hypothetical protein